MRSRVVLHSFRWAVAALAVTCFVLPAFSAEDGAKLKERVLALNDVTGDKTIEAKILLMAKDPDGTKKELKLARALVKTQPETFNYNAAYVLARAAENLKDYDSGLVFYRVCVKQAEKAKSPHQTALAYAGVLEVLFNAKKYDDALKSCREVVELKETGKYIQNLKTIAHKLMIQVLAKQGKLDDALKLADNQAQASPDDWTYLELKAMLLHDAGRDAEAVKLYQDIIRRLPDDPNLEKDQQELLVSRCHYILSGLYIDLDQVDKATAELKLLLNQRPNNPTYNNDLGYIWADHDMNLPEAERMIRKALAEDRKQRRKDPDLTPIDDHDNAAFLDSLGWVLYKEHKYEEALKPLLQAVADKDDGQSIEIYDHLGEVYKALGRQSDAIAAWQKGIKAAKTKRDEKIKARVEKKLKTAKQVTKE